MSQNRDVATGRRSPAEYAEAFSDLHPPLTDRQAAVEASRCHYCHDAPCVEACPTVIDIPGFIRRIATDNAVGAGKTILDANIMGATCARVCPVEELCEQVCVRNEGEHKPVTIAQLQRHATDALMATGKQPYSRQSESGKRVAVVGAGPAGLACAHRLATYGHDVTILESRAKPGGLNEYGLAAYKMPDDIAQKEVNFILGVGGINIETGRALGSDVSLDQLRDDYDAVFIGIGLGGVNALGVGGEDDDAVLDAVSYIADIRQAGDLADLPVGGRAVVIGGGNTAIDIAVQIKRLGADEVTLVYRRGPEQMGATDFEQELAQTSGVIIRHWAKPAGISGGNCAAARISFQNTQLGKDGKLEDADGGFDLTADQIFRAIGQTFEGGSLAGGEEPAMTGGRIEIDEERKTSLPDVWAGGDCVPGQDLTVSAVEDGKLAAESIHRRLSQ